MENRLRLLSEWLKGKNPDIDTYHDGALETAIKYAKADTLNEVGRYLEEILNLDDESVTRFLKEEQERELNKNKLPF